MLQPHLWGCLAGRPLLASYSMGLECEGGTSLLCCIGEAVTEDLPIVLSPFLGDTK